MQDDVIKASKSKTIEKTANELLASNKEKIFIFKNAYMNQKFV
jgi:hypothetical protein